MLAATLLAGLGALAAQQGASAGGVIEGHVTVQDTRRPRKPVRYHLGHLRSGRMTQPRARGGPRDVVIYVEDAAAGMRAEPPPPAPTMVQSNEEFVPHVVPIQTGMSVEFPNADEFYHNVFSVMAGDRFDLGRFGKGSSASQTFTRPGIVVVRCEIHSRMKAYVRVLDTACYTVPDSTGWFRIASVPEGAYTVKAWHPSRGEQILPVSVSGADTLRIGFDF